MSKVKCARDRDGWTSIIVEERADGVVIDWGYVVEGETRFIPREEIAWLGFLETNSRIAGKRGEE